MAYDVAIVGGGPTGLATSIAAARQGLSVVVVEKNAIPVDKACGEGVMPAGVSALEELGVFKHLDLRQCPRFEGIRFITERGRSAELPLPAPGGIGVRRTRLSVALASCARASGVELREMCKLLTYERGSAEVELSTTHGKLGARMMVAADGLNSGIRRAEGLDLPVPSKRFGIRQHWSCDPWTANVELYFARGMEAYVTPVGRGEVGVALLIDASVNRAPSLATAGKRYLDYLQHFPALGRRLIGARPTSEAIGSGFLEQAVSRTALDRLVLIGDAAGYVDAITGEGLSIGFAAALDFARFLPEALARGARARDFEPYTQAAARRFSRYRWSTRAMMAIARSGFLQQVFLHSLAGSSLFRQVVARIATAPAADVRSVAPLT